MRSWVRYSVAVYLGLMIAGAVGMQKPQSSQANTAYPVGIDSPFPHELYPHTWHRKPVGTQRKPGIGDAKSDAGLTPGELAEM
jgi:hypothetical protein